MSLLSSVAIIVIGYVADIRFLYKKIAIVHEQIASVKKQIMAKKEEARRLKLTERKSEPLLSLTPGKHGQPPLGTEAVNILGILESATIESQITSTQVEFQAEQENLWFTIYPVKLELEGDYNKLLKFINNLLQLPSLIIIEDLNIQKKKNDTEDNLISQVFLKVYKSKYVMASATINLSLQLPERDIFKPEIYKKNLFLWTNKELKFLGLIKQNHESFGVVGDPLGGVYRVVVGDRIGLKQSVISAIDACGITTEKARENVNREGKCP